MSYYQQSSTNNNNRRMSARSNNNVYCAPPINNIRPNYNKFSRPASGNYVANKNCMPGIGTDYGRQAVGMIKQPTESRWSFSGGSYQQQQQPLQQRRSMIASTYPSVIPNMTKSKSVGRSSSFVQQGSYSTSSPSSARNVNIAQMSNNNNGGVASTSSAEQLPAEGENVKYVRLNWEDILGGKDGINGLKVCMSPPTADNPNRQVSIGIGNSSTPTNDGTTQLKVLKFEPVENYPGQMSNNSTTTTTTTAPNNNNSSSNLNASYSNTSSANPSQYTTAYNNNNNGSRAPSGTQMPTVSVQSDGNGNPIIKLPPGYKIAGDVIPGYLPGVTGAGNNNGSGGVNRQGSMMNMNYMNNNMGNNNNNSYGMFQQQQQQGRHGSCNCASCQFKQPSSMSRRR